MVVGVGKARREMVVQEAMMLRLIHRVAVFILRPPAYNWPPNRGPWWARLRRWVWHIILRHESETCDACGGRVERAWWADTPELWARTYARATGRASVFRDGCGSGLLCCACFERHAPCAIEWRACRLGEERP
jgi:hypothetical protein